MQRRENNSYFVFDMLVSMMKVMWWRRTGEAAQSLRSGQGHCGPDPTGAEPKEIFTDKMTAMALRSAWFKDRVLCVASSARRQREVYKLCRPALPLELLRL